MHPVRRAILLPPQLVVQKPYAGGFYCRSERDGRRCDLVDAAHAFQVLAKAFDNSVYAFDRVAHGVGNEIFGMAGSVTVPVLCIHRVDRLACRDLISSTASSRSRPSISVM